MPWYSGLIFIVLLLAGCANNPTIGQKSFDKEDEFIIKALLNEDKNVTKAIDIYQNLYNETDKYVYFKRIIKLEYKNKNYNKTIKLVDKFIKKYPKKTDILEYKILSLIQLNKLDLALKYGIKVLKQNRNLKMYQIVGYIYIQKHNYKQAIKYLKSAYSISHNPDVLVEMGDIFFKYLHKPNEAISYYQTHIRLYGCEEIVCNRLANIYRSLYDYDNLIAIYKKLFNSTANNEYARKIVYLYTQNGEYSKAIKFINKYRLNKNLLYIVYKERLNNTKSYKDAYQLYIITNEPKYFFLYTVYKFDNSQKGLVDVKELISNLEYLVKKSKNPIYLNYLGYCLIDYDIDYKKGIVYIKEALKSNPDDIAYLDSLAWGYYKLKKCKKAYDIISKIDSDDEEINKHKKLIRRCYDIRQNYKKNKRKSKKR